MLESCALPVVIGSLFRLVPKLGAALDATCDDETLVVDDETLVGAWETCVDDDPDSTAVDPDAAGKDESLTPEDGRLVIVGSCDSCGESVLPNSFEET